MKTKEKRKEACMSIIDIICVCVAKESVFYFLGLGIRSGLPYSLTDIQCNAKGVNVRGGAEVLYIY